MESHFVNHATKTSTNLSDIIKSNHVWLKNNILYLTLAGSHGYGTNIATSDTDYRGIVVPPKKYYLGFKNKYENYVQKDPDLVVFELRKFIKLAIDNNPNVLEILFTNNEHHLFVHPLIETLLDNKQNFLSKKCKNTFSGYAMGQLKRIKNHRSWLLNPPKALPTRQEFGLPEIPLIKKNQFEAINAAIRKQLDVWNWHDLEDVDPSTRVAIQTQFETMLCEIMGWHWNDLDQKIWLSAANQIGLDTNMIEIITKEKIYSSKLKEWKQYQDWLKNRNESRAELEKNFGFDSKHGMHLIRLLRMCTELLEQGRMIVYRPDAEELLGIRNGTWTYDQLIEHAEQLEQKINSLYLTSSVLPDKVNEEEIDNLCMNIIERSFSEL